MISIKVPTVGESITEVTLLKWTKPEGAWVDRDEVIAELESEKATFEVNAEQAGTLHHKATEGDSILIGAILADIDEKATKPAGVSSKPEPVASAPAAPSKPTTPTSTAPVTSVPNNVKATPVAAAIIADKKVDTNQIKASGFAGKIKVDVLDALNNPGKIQFAGQDLFSRNVRPEKMSNLRKTISRRLVEAKKYHCHVNYFQ